MAVSIDNLIRMRISASRPPVERTDFATSLVFSDNFYFSDGSLTKHAGSAEDLLNMSVMRKTDNSPLETSDGLYKSVEMLTKKPGLKVAIGLIDKNEPNANIKEKYGITAVSDTFDKVRFAFKFRINTDNEVTVSVTGESGDDQAAIAVKFQLELESAPGFDKILVQVKTNTLEITTANFEDRLLVTHVTKTEVTSLASRVTVPDTGSRLSRVAEKTAFYFLLSPIRDKAKVLEMARWADGKTKLFVTASADPEISDIPNESNPGDIAASTFTRKYDNTVVLSSGDSDNFPDSRWVSERGRFEPASAKWAFAGLSGIIPDDINQNQLDVISSKNANCYTTIAGRDIIMGKNGGGTTASGKFIDIVIGTHWQQEELQKSLFSFLSDDERKTDFSNAGMLIIGQQFKMALEKGLKHFSKSYTLHIPKESDFTPDQIGSRRLSGIRWNIKPKHAVQGFEIDGRIED